MVTFWIPRSYLTFDMERQKYSTKYLPLKGRSNLSSKIINSQEKTFFHHKMILHEKMFIKYCHIRLSPSLKPVKSEYRSKWRQFSSPLTLRGKEEEDNFWFAGKLLLLGPWTSHVLPVLDTKCSNTNSLNRKKKEILTKVIGLENWRTCIYCLTDNQIGVRFMWK